MFSQLNAKWLFPKVHIGRNSFERKFEFANCAIVIHCCEFDDACRTLKQINNFTIPNVLGADNFRIKLTILLT